jgi:uncharacterized protein DUF6714
VLERVARGAFDAFRVDLETSPRLTLRGGDAGDSCSEPPPYDPAANEPTDAYLERYAFSGLPYLDPASWRHYLPRLILYACRHLTDTHTMVIDGLLSSLRPPDRVPPRLASLTAEQEDVVRAFLEYLALGDEPSPHRDFAMQVLEEWWLPNSLYRKPT